MKVVLMSFGRVLKVKALGKSLLEFTHLNN